MSQANSVTIITLANCNEEGPTATYIDSVWQSEAAARTELDRIKTNFNSNKVNDQWRARVPVGQTGCVSVELLKDNIWHCQLFYKSVTKPLQ